ncbi:spermidine synthase [Georgenia deserti]|uniref:Spermidine synthase n=1 Tax=Georgenia deserti TaxID=2093781 RepID=A0ABW4L2X4_9MICO
MSTSAPTPGESSQRETVVLSDGRTAQLVARDGGWSLEVDGVRQSHVGRAGDPPRLAAVRWMLAALGRSGPIRCAHLGGGLLALPRAIAEGRPGSRQLVIELDPVLVELTRNRFSIPEGVEVQVGDARAWLHTAAGHDFDAVVIDVFTGGRIPPAFTSAECFAAAREAISEHGVLVMNSVAGPELDFTRRQLATLRAVFGHVAMIVQGSALKGMRFGNATLIASRAALDHDAIRAELVDDSSRGALVTDVEPLIADARAVHDRDELWSPEPDLPDLDTPLRLIEEAKQMLRQARGRQPEQGD